MKIEKIFLDEIYRCYSTMAMELDGELHYFFASEEKGHPCYAYPHHDLKNRKVVWEQGGGTMSMIPLPNTKNQFIAIMDFYLKECPSQSKLVWFTYKDGAFIQKDLFYLPFLHRFDLYQVQDDIYFIGATIAHDKKDKEDWSLPGKIYTAKLPQDLNQTQDIKLEVLVDGLFRNHGYTRATEQDGGYFGSDEGITRVTIPQKTSGAWQVERIMSGQIGEIAVGDVNHDGKEEIMTIEPFHGKTIKIYEYQNEDYEHVFTYPREIDFAHTLVSAKVNGVQSFVGGIRRVNPDLFIIQYKDYEYQTILVDEGCGPANLNVIDVEGKTIIHSSNHTKNEASLYVVSE